MAGLQAQVADVPNALHLGRMFVKAGHLVVLGYGNEGGEHYIYNKAIGESNAVQDDGVNYVMCLYIASRAAAAR